MGRKRKAKYTLRHSKTEAFQLDTQDVSDFSTSSRRNALSHYLHLGGQKSLREQAEAVLFQQSWKRFFTVIALLLLIWVLGYFLP